MAFVELNSVYKIYKMGEIDVYALNDVSLCIEEGEFVVVVGPSGSGKTTMLNLLGGMDRVSTGDIFLNGRNITNFNSRELTMYRRYDIGFVFQFYNLVPNLTAIENVELAVQICNNHYDPKKALSDVGLTDRINNFPSQLSGGEQQRVSIARAIAKNPQILLCDEPTGALDYSTGKQVLSLLQDLSFKSGKTVIIITHNTALCDIANKVVNLREGKIQSIKVNKYPLLAEQLVW